MENLLNDIILANKHHTANGNVATYIPELKNANRDDLGICVIDKDNNIYQITDLFFIGKFNSSDIYNQLDIGQAYLVEVTGVRNRFFSWYRNINKIL